MRYPPWAASTVTGTHTTMRLMTGAVMRKGAVTGPRTGMVMRTGAIMAMNTTTGTGSTRHIAMSTGRGGWVGCCT